MATLLAKLLPSVSDRVILLQTPVDLTETLMKQLYKKAQAALVYDFILKHADVEYYVDDTPAEITVQTNGMPYPNSLLLRPLLVAHCVHWPCQASKRSYYILCLQLTGDCTVQQGLRAFPKGADIQHWHKMREHAQKDRDALREKAQRLYVDAKTLKKYKKDP